MQPGDTLIQTAFGPPLTVLDLVRRAKDFWTRAAPQFARAELNERFCHGRQWLTVTNDRIIPLAVPDWQPLVTKNLLRNFELTWASRVTKDRDAPKATPNESSPGDVAGAEAANAVLDYQRQAQDRDAMLAEAALTVQEHGSVIGYVVWDSEEGKHTALEPVLDEFNLPARDDQGQPVTQRVEVKGEVVVEMLTIYDYATDGAEFIKDSRELVVRRWLSPEDAMERLHAAGMPLDFKVDKQPQRWLSSDQREVVEAFEVWHKPTPRVPGGCRALVIGETVVEYDEKYPYTHGRLPAVEWKCQRLPGSPFGDTHVSDAIGQQQRLNETLSAIQRLAEIIRGIRGIGHTNVIDAWGEAPEGFIALDVAEPLKAFGFIEYPKIPAELFELVDRYEKGISDCFGVSEVVSGMDPNATKNARHTAYISELDGQKLAIAKRNLEAFLLGIDEQVLELVQQFWTQPRLVSVVGEDGAVAADFFRGADVRGVDLRLEPAPGSERFRAAQGQAAEESAAAGFLDPAAASERRETGLGRTLQQGEQRRAVNALVQAALAGEMQAVDPRIPAEVAVPELRAALMLYRPLGSQRLAPLRALIHEYEEMAQQMEPPLPTDQAANAAGAVNVSASTKAQNAQQPLPGAPA